MKKDPLEAFSDYLKYEKGCSAHTVNGYRADLSGLSHFSETVPLEKMDPATLRGYVASLFGKVQPVSVARKLSSIRAFYRFLVKNGMRESSPAEEIETCIRRGKPFLKRKERSSLTRR